MTKTETKILILGAMLEARAHGAACVRLNWEGKWEILTASTLSALYASQHPGDLYFASWSLWEDDARRERGESAMQHADDELVKNWPRISRWLKDAKANNH